MLFRSAHAYSIQYHVELTDRTVAEWGAVPAYAQALEAALGRDALTHFERDAVAALPDCNALARRLYDNFMGLIVR